MRRWLLAIPIGVLVLMLFAGNVFAGDRPAGDADAQQCRFQEAFLGIEAAPLGLLGDRAALRGSLELAVAATPAGTARTDFVGVAGPLASVLSLGLGHTVLRASPAAPVTAIVPFLDLAPVEAVIRDIGLLARRVALRARAATPTDAPAAAPAPAPAEAPAAASAPCVDLGAALPAEFAPRGADLVSTSIPVQALTGPARAAATAVAVAAGRFAPKMATAGIGCGMVPAGAPRGLATVGRTIDARPGVALELRLARDLVNLLKTVRTAGEMVARRLPAIRGLAIFGAMKGTLPKPRHLALY